MSDSGNRKDAYDEWEGNWWLYQAKASDNCEIKVTIIVGDRLVSATFSDHNLYVAALACAQKISAETGIPEVYISREILSFFGLSEPIIYA